MRTTIDIDAELMKEAMTATGQKTAQGSVEESLRQVIKLAGRRQALEELRGMGWSGDPEDAKRGTS